MASRCVGASAAASLGAGPLTVFRRVTVPMIAPSLRAGLVLAWARALGEFGATITFAGNLQGRTQALQDDIKASVASTINMVLRNKDKLNVSAIEESAS